MNLQAPLENTSPKASGLTHILHSTANIFKDLEEAVNVFDPVQNHLLFLRNSSRILDSFSQFTCRKLVSSSLH